MKVWLFTVGEPLPIDQGEQRLLRTGHLAHTLAARGHSVVWWTSAFDHVRKSFRSESDQDISLATGLELRLVRGLGYGKNISAKRIWDHLILARRIKARLHSDPSPPEVMVASLPTPEIASVVASFGKKRGIPTVVDVRDLWPDVLETAFPEYLRLLARPLLSPFRALTRQACADATAISGHAPAFVEWGLRHAGRARRPMDRDFPHGYFADPPAPPVQQAAFDYWKELGLNENQFIVCYFGAVGHQFDLDTVFDAVGELSARKEVRFVLCGDGVI